MLKLNIAFWDIETDFDPERGFADPVIPSIPSLYRCTSTMARCTYYTCSSPKTMQFEDAQKMCKDRWGDDVILFTNDKDGNGERSKCFKHLI